MRAEQRAFLQNMADGHDERQQGRRNEVSTRPGRDERQSNQLVRDPMQVWMLETAPSGRERRPTDQYRCDAGHELRNIPLGRVERFESHGEDQAARGRQCQRQAQRERALFRLAQ